MKHLILAFSLIFSLSVHAQMKKDGMKKGMMKGMKKGMMKGMKKGMMKGMKKGMMKGMKKGKWPMAKVMTMRGTATLNGDPISKDMMIKKSGSIKVASRSFVKLFIEKWGNTIVLGPRSEMYLELEKPNEKKRYNFVNGACRWVTSKVKKKDGKVAGNGVLHTKNASLGVRGTDYFVKVNKMLGETEIIVFDGKVEFTNNADQSDKAMISKGQWGGLGGRFGSKIGKVLDLPPNVVGHFNKMLILK